METEILATYFKAAVNTMQQRGYTTMNIEDEEKPSQASRGRQSSKLKVLVRSHAIREETSPPRESSPTHLLSPSIKVIPSADASLAANPVVVLSPSLSRVASPSLSPVCVSPTSTLVPSPTSRNSPQGSPQHCNESNRIEVGDDSPKYLSRLNRQNLERDARREHASHNNHRRKIICDCANQNCAKCKSQERNINNNLTNVNNNVPSSNTLTVNSRVNSRNKLRQQSSSQGSFEGSSSNSPCLSRDSSSEQYTDTSGADLEVFIPETINRNAKDRAFMLRIEQELVSLAKDKSKTHYKFPPMSSYQRMLVHRCAAYFGMDHNIESSGKCVVVNKTRNTRIPEVEFKEHIKDDVVFSEEPRRSILKRDSNSVEDYGFKSPDRQYSLENRRSKSFEEREEEYAKVRRRIFNREELCFLRQMHDGGGSNEDFEWADIPWSSTESDSRFRLQLPEHGRRTLGKLTKVLSEEVGEASRPYVAKSYSFGGYAGVLNRGDSVVSTHSAGPRLLTKQDSGASSVSWRLSPSSSGYKSQSQMSESITPSPTSTPNQIVDPRPDDDKESGDSVVWAVTDIQRVPKGSIIINPQTGEPIKNEDGSLYHYDPNNPPPGFVNAAASKPPPSPSKKASPQTSPKKQRVSKLSPSHKSSSHLTNSSTSPSLPYSPPLPPHNFQQQQQRNFQFVQGMAGDGMAMAPPQQQQFPVYGGGYGAPPSAHEGVPFYQQPCIVYTTPYSVPISPHFEGRMEPQSMSEMGGTFYVNVQDNAPAPAPQTLTYQQPPPSYWNQQPITFYQNAPASNPTPPQRFPVHPPPNQSSYMSSYQPNYLAQPNQAPPPAPAADLVSVFPQQPVQLVYSSQNQQNPPLMYPNQSNIVYAQNPVYSTPMYPPSQPLPPGYPQGSSTPNSCTSSISQQFSSHVVQQQQQDHHQNVMQQLSQNMSQLGFAQHQGAGHQNYVMNKMAQAQKGGQKFGSGPRGFVLGSSQSSTGTNSPAATVVAGYCPQSVGMYRTPPETPPNQFNYGTGFPVPPMLLRQMSNVRANTPGTARSSRSPTPAGDISHFDRPRMPPPTVYHGLPYVLPADNRMIPGRPHPNPYRHPPPMKQHSFNQENKSHKTRKPK